MLHLASPSDDTWAERALLHLDVILLDHAHCEKKAAATAVGLIFRYQDEGYLGLMEPLSRLAREELAHFEEVLRHLSARGQPFRRLHPSRYAAELCAAVRTHEPAKLIDTLLCCALIEARSCERMKLLAEALDRQGGEPALAALYHGLLASEARHHQSYLDLALAAPCATEGEVRGRLAALARHEAAVLARLPREPRMHSA